MSNIINCYVDMWKNFANFSGRTNVGGYWWACLANFIVSFVIGLTGVEVLATVYSLAALIPTISIAVRRLRDAAFFPELIGGDALFRHGFPQPIEYNHIITSILDTTYYGGYNLAY